MEKIAKNIIESLKIRGADYADIRLHTLDLTESYSTLKGILKSATLEERTGYGIRVLKNGSWGFSSSENIEEIEHIAITAFEQAEAASTFMQEKIELSPKEIFKDEFTTNTEIDPFEVETKEKLNHLLKLESELASDRFELWGISANFYKRRIYYVDTEGAEIIKNLIEVDAGMFCMGNDKDGLRQRRSFTMFCDHKGSVGWENFLSEKQFASHPKRIKEELLQILDAPVCEEQICDIILLPEMMALQTHETIGHALELDRILGYELSYAGGSHIDLEHFGELQFASSKLNAHADGTTKNSPGSQGYDDDGVKARDVLMIKDGKLENAITSRQMIVEANKKANKTIFKQSGAANRAESYNSLPIERMNNINIDFGEDGTLEDIIKDTTNGIILESPRSWSIGSNRENFHFACEIGWLVKNGKIEGVVRNPTYKGDSLPFWRGLDKVGNESTWQLQQVFHCGKGQPNQIMRLGHGIPVCRFSNVQVGNK